MKSTPSRVTELVLLRLRSHRFYVVVVTTSYYIMLSTEPTAEVLTRLFLDPDAPLGQAWLQFASIPMSYDSRPRRFL
jgi:hypothetical protein